MAGRAAMSLDFTGRLRTSTDARHDLQGERCLLRHWRPYLARRASAFSLQAAASCGKLVAAALRSKAAMMRRMRARVVAAGGAGSLAVGAVRRRSALLVLLAVLVVALAGAGPLGAGALVALGVPVLAAAVLTGAGALAGAVGGLLAGPGAVEALATRVVGCSKALPQLGQVRQMIAVIAPPPPRSAAARSRER
jgi:hypothetical protein